MSDKTTRVTMLYSSTTHGTLETMWKPAADVYRTSSGWLLKFELAGVALDDVTVTARGSAITVSGVRRDHVSEGNCCLYSMEIMYSQFERTVHLPCEIESAQLDIQIRNGILLVRATL